ASPARDTRRRASGQPAHAADVDTCPTQWSVGRSASVIWHLKAVLKLLPKPSEQPRSMARLSPGSVTVVPLAQLELMRRALERGMHLQAWQVAEKLPALNTWAGADARCLAGRLAFALGNPSWQRRLHLRAWKEAPAHPEAFYHYIVLVMETRGALAGWQLLKK